MKGRLRPSLIRDLRAELAKCSLSRSDKIVDLESKILAIECLAQRDQMRVRAAAKSPRIATVIRQLKAIEDLAVRAARGEAITVPENTCIEVYQALAGLPPYSEIDFARVTRTMLDEWGPGYWPAGATRVLPADAPIATAVLESELRPSRDEPHLLALRTWARVRAVASAYFFADLPEGDENRSAKLRMRLAEMIQPGSAEFHEYVENVCAAVARALTDADRQNPGRRTIHSWTQADPDGALIVDLCDALWENERHVVAGADVECVQSLVIWLRDPELLVGASDKPVADATIWTMLGAWNSRAAHLAVAAKLSDVAFVGDHAGGDVSSFIDVEFASSLAELNRRLSMGDAVSSKPFLARASGRPAAVLDLRKAAQAENYDDCWRAVEAAVKFTNVN